MRALRGVVGGLILLALAGCGGGDNGVVVGGTVTKGGSPITIGDSEGMTITLTGGGNTFTANVDEKGTFAFQKPAGGGIPPGKYQVSYVHYQNASPYTKAKPFRHEKKLDDWEVSAANTKLDIKLDGK